MGSELLTFLNRDYGPREIPDDATMVDVTDEEDCDVYVWLEGESVVLQQGYDRILLSSDGIEALKNHVRVVPVP